jgi:arylsulfatase A-like enzyme
MSKDPDLKTIINLIYEKSLAKRNDSGAKRITKDVINEFKLSRDKPRFIFMNYMEPHLEYNPPKEIAINQLPSNISYKKAQGVNQDPWKYISGEISMSTEDFEILKCLYKAELKYLDSQLGNLFDKLEQLGELDNTCFMIVGDHGENIGDHGLMDHQYTLSQTLIHVPFSLRYPNKFESKKVQSLVETKSIYDTVCDIAGVDSQVTTKKSLVSSDLGNNYAIAEYPEPHPSVDKLRNRVNDVSKNIDKYDRSLRSIQKGNWKYMQGSDGYGALYNLAEDPEENSPLSDRNQIKDIQKILDSNLGEMENDYNSSKELDGSIQDRLNDLGYI